MSRKRNNDSNATFSTVYEFSRRSGLSQKYIREAIKTGAMPHIMTGNTYKIPTNKALEMLTQQAISVSKC